MADKKDPIQSQIEKFTKTMLDLVAAAANGVAGLKDAKKPEEAILNLARVFDKLSVRCAREAVLVSEAEKPRPINPLVEITSINLASNLKTVARDLEHGKGLPKTWEETAAALKENVKVAQAVQLIISQTGVSGTVVLPGTPLKDEDGNPIVDN